VLAQLAVRTGHLPSQWAAELEQDERAVWTVYRMLQEQDERNAQD
jgi:hypothetical protein